MRLFIFILTLFRFNSVGSGYAQFRDHVNYKNSQHKFQLTPEMFIPQISQYGYSTASGFDIPFLESKVSKRIILLGSNLLTNKLDFDIPTYTSISAYPTTVSEYNNVILRQKFMTEPTCQKQRYPSFFPF